LAHQNNQKVILVRLLGMLLTIGLIDLLLMHTTSMLKIEAMYHKTFMLKITYLVFYSGAAVMLAELAVEAGLPNGVLNIVHGTNVRLATIVYHSLFIH
jgi:malonate-semialdehyde dehydrogenase (acetylating)/methylmalonate-semialdehyde dehydrogenase